ncbi:hypothetical protein LCGC14_3050700, partial [marine sediment metagenome]
VYGGASGAAAWNVNTRVFIEDDANAHLTFVTPNTTISGIAWADDADSFIGAVRYNHVADQLEFYVDNGNRATLSATDFDVTGDATFDEAGFGGAAAPASGIAIGSTDGSDEMNISGDNTNFWIKWSEGVLKFITDEGTNTNTDVRLYGKGTGAGFLRLYDQDDAEHLYLRAVSGQGYVSITGTAEIALNLQHTADAPVRCFSTAAGVERPTFEVYGRDGATTPALKHIAFGISGTAADTANITGVATYDFDGVVNLSGGSAGAAPTPQLSLGTYHDNTGDPSISHIDIHSGQYGFGVSANALNYFSNRLHQWFDDDVPGTYAMQLDATTGNLDVAGNITADSYTDHTPGWTSTPE